jgi:hypothetical protein
MRSRTGARPFFEGVETAERTPGCPVRPERGKGAVRPYSLDVRAGRPFGVGRFRGRVRLREAPHRLGELPASADERVVFTGPPG